MIIETAATDEHQNQYFVKTRKWIQYTLENRDKNMVTALVFYPSSTVKSEDVVVGALVEMPRASSAVSLGSALLPVFKFLTVYARCAGVLRVGASFTLLPLLHAAC